MVVKLASIRVVEIDGAPLFVAADVCRVLGLGAHNGSISHHLGRLRADETTSTSNLEVTNPGTGMRKARLVSESGLYKLVMRSDKPVARQFQDWVTREVLPMIRKTGRLRYARQGLAGGLRRPRR
jgi:prophage antirepressor-like protein